MSGTGFLRLTDDAPIPDTLRGAVVAIGNFDGVHRGHQAVLALARSEAKRRGAPFVVLTFEPHPRTIFSAEAPVERLTPAATKAFLFRVLGADAVAERPFDRTYAALSATAFVEETLVAQLGARHVVVGYDFRFGARRSGDAAVLAAEGERCGFTVDVVDALADRDGEAVSSSRIREELRSGQVEAAAGLLGYRWTVAGEIVHGAKLGRSLGYPTANMVLPFPDLLAHGIYAVRLRRANGQTLEGVASYGRRPTFDDGAPLFETFLFGFSGDLYGEERFESAAALVAQMDRDAENARDALLQAEPLSPLDASVAF